jgi:hypothetical protein
MKLPKSRPTLLWQTALQDIRACRAEPLQDEDVVWLYLLAQRVITPADGRLPFARAPIRCGNVWLYRLSLQGLNWLAALDPWWPGSDLLPAAFACAHSTDKPEPLFQHTDHAVIKSTVLAWADTLDCTLEDLRLATQIQTGFPDAMVETDPKPRDPNEREASTPAPSDLDATQWGAILALLAGAYHIPPWTLLMRPFEDINQLLTELPTVATLYGNIPGDKKASATLQAFQEAVLFLKRGGTTTSDLSAVASAKADLRPPSSAVQPSPVLNPALSAASVPSAVQHSTVVESHASTTLSSVPSARALHSLGDAGSSAVQPSPLESPVAADLSAVASAKAELRPPNSELRTQHSELRTP